MTPPPPCVGRRSRRKRLCSRGGYSREIITTLYGEISREFRWEFYLFTRLALDCWNRYIYMCMHIYFSIVVSRVVSILAIITGFIRFFFAEIRSTMPPMINEKVVYMSARLKDTVVIPCVAYGNPTPTNR